MFKRGGRLHPSRLYYSRKDPVDRLIHQEIARHRADPETASREDVLSLLIAARDDDGCATSCSDC
jgi:cytochrome P450